MLRSCFGPVAFLCSVWTKEPWERNKEGEREGEGGREGGRVREREGGERLMDRDRGEREGERGREGDRIQMIVKEKYMRE